MALAAILSIAGSAKAAPVVLRAPSSPVPPSVGTGISSRWVNGSDPANYEELDRALSYLTPESFLLEGVGPVSLSNDLAPIGDFATHAPMPYSTEGTPADTGWYLATRMTGAWAARKTGTYTFAIGADDGFRVTLAGTVLLEHAASQPFRRQAASFVVNEVGLYPIMVEYFNGVQEGAIELSVTSGEVPLLSETAPLSNVFQVVPVTDLYPPAALDGPDGGSGSRGGGSSGTSDEGDAGAPLTPAGNLGDASPEPTSSGDASESLPNDANASERDQWHGGGCSLAVARDSGWFGSVFAMLVAAAFVRRR
jgi:hypothetical protein